MQGSRLFPIKKKATIVLNKSFAIYNDLDVGDKGQCIVEGIIEGEALDQQDDGTELFIKTIRISSVKSVNVKEKRQ